MGTPISVKKNQVLKYEYTGAARSVTLPAGTYKLEVWGAQGGNYETNYGGAGGYSVGTLTITQNTDFYIYVGSQPASTSTTRTTTHGGYNGGGAGCNRDYNGTYTYGQGGGGGTDIRIGQDSLYARVIVAGGGGGSASNGDEARTKYGGGLTGGCASANFAGSQTSGGVGNAGSFGKGGSVSSDNSTGAFNYKYGPGGGGGGWYGGGNTTAYSDTESDIRVYNGGGSGYVYTADTATNYPSGCLLNSSYYLAEAQTIAGNTSFPSPNGGTETGHEGNGYARITVLAVESSISASVKVGGQWHQANEMFVKVNGVWKECVEAWMKVNGVWKSLAESTPSTSATYTITLGANVGKITANGEIPQRDKLSYHVSKGDTIVVTSTTFNANSYTMVFSHTPANVSFSKKTNNGTGTRATTSVTFTMPASDLTVGFTLKSGAGA
uniref:receptor protein-tyrosine kinase n=1 Tax=Siphoviridae sp. ctg6c78 TaxID=2825603 RepID=A0A8S5URB1_9CAUD|nr:MAG TPA: Glycine rich protein [Siphoviridae sp. ctg6c78]